jgi:hypothetical protein
MRGILLEEMRACAPAVRSARADAAAAKAIADRVTVDIFDAIEARIAAREIG